MVKTKTREEITDDLIKLEKEIRQRGGIVFDEDWLHFFEKWRKEKNKYQDLNIEEVEFEEKEFKEVFNIITPNRKIKKKEMKEKGIYPVVSQSQELINGYYDDKKGVIEIKDKPLIIFGDHTTIVKYIDFNFLAGADGTHILEPKNNLYSKYLYFHSLNRIESYGYSRHFQYFKELKFYIPKPYKTYSSYDIQKILVEFLEDNKKISDKWRKRLDSVDKDIKEMEDNLIPAIFAKNDDYIKKMWIKWNTDPVEPRKKEDMVDFTLEDIEFEEKKIDEFVNSKGGSSKYNKKYYQDENNFGDYPLMTGSLNIVGYVKPISQDDIIEEESISYNKDNDGGSKAFYHNKPYIVGGHHYALLIKDKYKKEINIKYFYYIMMEFFNKNKFYQSKQPVANIGIIKEKYIKIPKPIKTKTKEYSSYEVQEAIVSFIDRFYRWKATIKSVMNNMRGLLDEMDEGFLYKTFKGRE